MSDAAADALAEALANVAPAAGSASTGEADTTTAETERTRDQVAAIEAQQRDNEQLQTDRGPALIVDAGIPDTLFEGGSSFTFQLPVDVFSIVGGDPAAGLISDLSLVATLADGSELPEWLIFDSELNEFRGAPPPGEELTFEIRIVATDLLGNEAAATFQMILETAAGESEPRDADSTGNKQQSATDGAPSPDEMLTTAMFEAENAQNFGENPLSTGESTPHAASEIAAKPSLTGQIKETGFGKFQAEALRLALGRSG